MNNENSPTLETQRLMLRKFCDKDIDDMFIIYSNKVVNKFLPWFPLENIEQTIDYLHNKIYPVYEKEIGYNYAIVLKKTNRVVGFICLNNIDKEEKCAELGYGLNEELWGQGIIAEASAILLEKAKRNGFKYITATHDINNNASGRVMQKIGMNYVKSYDELCQPKNYIVTFKLYRIDF